MCDWLEMAGPIIEMVPYRTQWRSQYAVLAALLCDALGDAVIALHHIGSTAVPDLVAKDIIDIQLTAASLADYPYQRIEAVGFEPGKPTTDHCPPGLTLPRQELAKRFYKYRRSAANLHVRERGRFNQRYPLLCRDYLRTHKMAAAAYGRSAQLVNIVNFRRFLSILARYVALYNLPVEVIIAGNVCDGIAEDYPFAKKLGFLDDSAEFYRMVVAGVIPLEFSTGIKIKVAEALAWNVPVLATRDAFDGFRAYHPTQHAPTLPALCEILVALAYGEIPPDELAWATRQAGIAAAAAQERGFAELQGWIDTSLGPVVRACRELLSCLNQPLQELGVDEVVERAGALSRDDAYRPLAGHCAHQICQTLGYPVGSWGLSQKIFQRNFDLHGQIKWINQQIVLNG